MISSLSTSPNHLIRSCEVVRGDHGRGPRCRSTASQEGPVRVGYRNLSSLVDVYLTAPGTAPSTTPLARDVAYGAVTSFQSLAPGRDTVDMRAAGAAPDSPPPVTSAVDVAAGSAQSLLFFDTGAGGAVQGNLLTDDLTPAAAGDGRVRIVQGAADAAPVDMQALGGPRLATSLEYGTATDYATVAAQLERRPHLR